MGKRAIRIIAVILYIIAVAALCVILYAAPKIQGFGMQTEIVEYADLPVQDIVEGVFVRDETLYLASASGTPQYLIEEGTKVRRGMQVFWVDAAPEPEGSGEPDADLEAVKSRAGSDALPSEGGVAPLTAIVNYFGDGYEKKITPEPMAGLTREDIAALPEESTDLVRDYVRAGDPAYRITDNNLWYFVFWKERAAHMESSEDAQADEALTLPEEEEDADAADAAEEAPPLGADTTLPTGALIDDYTAGRVVTLDLGTTRVSAKVESVETRQEGFFVVLSSDMYYRDLVKYRKRVTKVIFEEYSGAVLGARAVAARDGQDGVFVKQQSGTWKWVPVQVLRRSGSLILLSEGTYYDKEGAPVRTVNFYDEVMSDPAEEGYA